MPYLGSTFFVVFMILGLFLAIGAFLLLVRSLFPRFVQGADEQLSRRPISTFLLGTVLSTIGLTAVTLVLSIPNGATKFLGSVGLAILICAALAGMAGAANLIGRGLRSKRDEDRPWFATLKGAAVLQLSFLLPFVGWFVLFPGALMAGFGAFVWVSVRGVLRKLGLVSRPQATASTPALTPSQGVTVG